MDVFAGYQEDAWPTSEQLAVLPRSRTGLGLDQPLAVVQAAVVAMEKAEFLAVAKRFCRGTEDDGCQCGAFGENGDSADPRHVDAHITAEDVAMLRLAAVWALHHTGGGWINGQPASDFLDRVSIYG